MRFVVALVLVFLALVSSSEVGSSTYIYPETFGNATHADFKNALSCGAAMHTYNSVTAYSNGAYQGTGTSCGGYGTYGYHYQCVEYVQRYFATKHGTTPIWHGNAIDLCDTRPSGVKLVSTPVAGDGVVFNIGTYGHTAIVTSISGGYVNVVEQNAAASGTNSYSTSKVKCYLHYGSTSTGSCSHLGYYCGNDGLGMNPNNLYYCSGAGAVPSLKTSCSFTCVTMPSGYDDVCSTSGTCSTVNTGYYCGSDKVNGDSSTLYYCKSSAPYGARKCANGCHVAASGYDDYCN